MAEITVIMATYMGAEFLEAQLDSIKRQSLAPSEMIVTDDQSTDLTQEILENYASKNKIRFYINSARKGVIGNFKQAASFANPNHYLSMSDQDDIWHTDKLEISLKELQNMEVEDLPCIVYSDPAVIDQSGNKVANSLWDILGFNNYPHTLETVLYGNPAGGCTMLLNPAAAKYFSTLPANTYMHDAWLLLCAFTFGKSSPIPGPLMDYRQHSNNVTFSNKYSKKSRFRRVIAEVLNALFNKDALFKEQFTFVRQFFEQFNASIPANKRIVFLDFLALEKKGYLTKKLAFRKAMRNAFLQQKGNETV